LTSYLFSYPADRICPAQIILKNLTKNFESLISLFVSEGIIASFKDVYIKVKRREYLIVSFPYATSKANIKIYILIT